MTSKLPAIEMPIDEPPQSAREPMTPRVDPIDNILQELGDKDMPEDVEDEGEIVPVEPKPTFDEEEVFNDNIAPSAQRAQTTLAPSGGASDAVKEEDVMNSEIGEVPEKKGRRKYKRKGEMTEKQRLHLERIRAKAAENRKKRKEEKELAAKEKEKEIEELRKEKKNKELEKQKQKEIEAEARVSEGIANKIMKDSYTKQDLEEAVVNAIHTYDTHRKEQKAEKKKKQAEEAQKNRQTRLIQQAINPDPPKDIWRQYFT